MHKLPVFSTAGNAYRFLLREFGTIVRLSWLPLLVVAVVQYVGARQQIDVLRSAMREGIANAWGFGWQLLGYLLVATLIAIAAVALHRVILFDERRERQYAYVSLGKVEVFFVIVPIIGYLLIVIALIPVVTLAVLSGNLFVVLLGASALIALLLLALRLSLIFPVMVVERRIDVRQVWQLTRHNGWRVIGLWVTVVVPMLLVSILLQYALFGTMKPPSADMPSAVLDRFEEWLIPGTILNYVLLVINTALGVATLSYAYKALRGHAPDDAVSRPT